MGNCIQYISLNDAHGSNSTWMTSFIKYEGYIYSEDDPRDDDDPSRIQSGYIPADAIFSGLSGLPIPSLLVGLVPGPGTTFSIEPGKLDANGNLLPCSIEAAGSGPCLKSRIWEIDLGFKDFVASYVEPETHAWISPYGGSSTSECRILPYFNDVFARVVPTVLVDGARSYNNVRPPSYHVDPPLPHESVQFALTLRDGDGSGQGWWNTLKYHSNQYVLDDGESILHRGTLVDKGETTDKFALKDGTYYLRMLGNLDNDAYDDTWSLSTKDGVIASGGRYNRATLVVSGGAISSTTVDNVFDTPTAPASKHLSLAKFEGLLSVKDFEPSAHKSFENIASSHIFKQYSHMFTVKDTLETLAPKQSFTETLAAHPMDTAGILLATALFGMISMYGVLSLTRPSTTTSAKYEPVMDISQKTPTPRVEIQLEKGSKREVPVCQL